MMLSRFKSNFPALIYIYIFSLPTPSAFASPLAAKISNELAPSKEKFLESDNATPAKTSYVVARASYPDEAACSAAIIDPPRDKSLFFSKLPSGKPMREFLGKGYKSLNRVYSQEIMMLDWDGDDPEYIANWDRLSRIFAEHSSGTVTVLLGREEACSTWVRVEFPALKDNGRVEEAISVDPNDTNSKKTIYKKGQSIKRQGLPPWDGGECLDFEDRNYSQWSNKSSPSPPARDRPMNRIAIYRTFSLEMSAVRFIYCMYFTSLLAGVSMVDLQLLTSK